MTGQSCQLIECTQACVQFICEIKSSQQKQARISSYYVLLLSFIVMEIVHCHAHTLLNIFGHLVGFNSIFSVHM